jgi:hypothetical protein
VRNGVFILDVVRKLRDGHPTIKGQVIKGFCFIPYQMRLLQNSRIPCEAVTPAEAGVQNALKRLDSGFRWNDAK